MAMSVLFADDLNGVRRRPVFTERDSARVSAPIAWGTFSREATDLQNYDSVISVFECASF